jgi:hypothetical protein
LPEGPDAKLVAQVFKEAAVPSQSCAGVEDLIEGIEASAGTALLAEEALTQPILQQLVEALAHHPAWSDFPLVIFFNRGGETVQTSRRMLAT